MEIVIVGGGYAGLSCALRLAHRARRAGRPVRVRLINPAPVLVERIRLHQAATGQRLRERRLDRLLERAGVELVLGRATAVDPEARTVEVGGQWLRWDRLVLALGSQAGGRQVPGAAEHAQALEPPGASEARGRLQGLPSGARVAVVGGGLTGLEAAAEIAESHPHLGVQLVCRGGVVDDFGIEGRGYVKQVLESLGVVLSEGVDVRAVRDRQLDTVGGPIPFDLCVWTAGFRLPALPREAGLQVNARGQVLVDPALRSVSHPHIYAVGDIAAPVLDPGQPMPMGCKSAMPAGVHAGDNLVRELAGRELLPFDYALLFYCVSLGRRAGLIQWADAQGRPTGKVLTGARGALFKEVICRTTWWALLLEARGRKAVVWKTTGRAPRELPAGELVA